MPGGAASMTRNRRDATVVVRTTIQVTRTPAV
jgi:hypothetical protein